LRFDGTLHGRKTEGASRELSLDLDPGGESKSRSMIKSKTTRFMGIMHGRKTAGTSHEPALGLGLPVEIQTEMSSRARCRSRGRGLPGIRSDIS
jgi:hypothetical protein